MYKKMEKAFLSFVVVERKEIPAGCSLLRDPASGHIGPFWGRGRQEKGTHGKHTKGEETVSSIMFTKNNREYVG